MCTETKLYTNVIPGLLGNLQTVYNYTSTLRYVWQTYKPEINLTMLFYSNSYVS